MSYKYIDAAALRGKTITEIEQKGNDLISISTNDGSEYLMQHIQDCCESVRIYDIVGNLSDLVGSPLKVAKEESSRDWPEDVERDCEESYTWTTYHFHTKKAKVCIRWLGTSNGYYSESVEIDQIK